MNPSDLERLLQTISQSGGSRQTRENAERVRRVLQTASGQQAVRSLMEQYGTALEQAARLAQSGNPDGARQSVQHMLRTPQGAQLAAQIRKMMGR